MNEFEKGYEQGYKDGTAGAALPNVNDNGDKIDGYNYAYKTDSRGEPYIHIDSVRSMLKKAADGQPVKRGRWIDCTFYDPCEKSWEQDFEFECSNCGHKIYNKPNDNNLFCGHCSARMDGDTE